MCLALRVSSEFIQKSQGFNEWNGKTRSENSISLIIIHKRFKIGYHGKCYALGYRYLMIDYFCYGIQIIMIRPHFLKLVSLFVQFQFVELFKAVSSICWLYNDLFYRDLEEEASVHYVTSFSKIFSPPFVEQNHTNSMPKTKFLF